LVEWNFDELSADSTDFKFSQFNSQKSNSQVFENEFRSELVFDASPVKKFSVVEYETPTIYMRMNEYFEQTKKSCSEDNNSGLSSSGLSNSGVNNSRVNNSGINNFNSHQLIQDMKLLSKDFFDFSALHHISKTQIKTTDSNINHSILFDQNDHSISKTMTDLQTEFFNDSIELAVHKQNFNPKSFCKKMAVHLAKCIDFGLYHRSSHFLTFLERCKIEKILNVEQHYDTKFCIFQSRIQYRQGRHIHSKSLLEKHFKLAKNDEVDSFSPENKCLLAIEFFESQQQQWFINARRNEGLYRNGHRKHEKDDRFRYSEQIEIFSFMRAVLQLTFRCYSGPCRNRLFSEDFGIC
jgi:hypothetical protein